MSERRRWRYGAGVGGSLGVLCLAVSLLTQHYLPAAAAALLTATFVAAAGWLLVERLVAARLRRQLATSERRLDAVIEASDVILWTATAEGDALTLSPGWEAYTGRSVEASRGKGWQQAVHPDDVTMEAAAWHAAVANGTPFRIEYRVWHAPSASWRWNSERAVPLRDVEGRVQSWLGLSLDVDDRRRAEESLRAGEERYRRLVQQSREGIWFLEFDPPIPLDLPEDEFVDRYLGSGRIVECNDAFARCYGFERAGQVVGLGNADLLVRDDPLNIEMVREFVRGQFALPRWHSIDKDREGRYRVMDSSLSGICADGALVGEWGIQRDVTAERAAQDELEAERQRFESVLDTVPVGVSVKDASGAYLYMNREQLRYLGWEDDGYQGRSTLDLPDSAHAQRMKALDAKVLATGEPVRGHADTTEYMPGVERKVIMAKSPLRDASGEVTGIASCELDVTDLETVRDALSRSEQRWRRVFEAVPVAIEIFDHNGEFVEGNPASHQLFGTPTPGARQTNLFSDLDLHQAGLEADLRAGGRIRWEGWYDFMRLASRGVDTRGREERRYVVALIAALSDAAAGDDDYVCISVDETERRRADEVMRDSEARYRRFLDNSHEGIFRIEFDPPVPLGVPLEEQVERYYASGRLAECNGALAEQHGYPDSAALLAVVGADLRRLVTDDSAEPFLRADCRSRDALVHTRHRDGSEVLLRVNRVGEIVDGQLVREWGVGQDVTREIISERERREQQALLTTVMGAVPLGITVKDAQGRFTYVNRWMCEVAGLEPEDLLGQTIDMLDGVTAVADIAALDRLVLDTGEPVAEHRTRLVRASDGKALDLIERKAPILDEQRRAVGVVTSLMDVSQIEEARRSLEEERTLLQTVLDTAPISITIKDSEARYRYVNRRARDVSRWGSNQIEGRTAADVDAPIYAADVLALDRRVLETGVPAYGVEVGGTDPDSGEIVMLQLNKAPLRDAAGGINGLVSCTLDVSERTRAQRALEEQRALFASVLDALPLGVSLRDRDRRFRYVNNWWGERFGFQPQEVLGRTIEQLSAVTDSAQMSVLDRQVLEDGRVIADVQSLIRSADGSIVRAGLVSKLPLRDASGEIEGIITCTQDISARRSAEQALESQRSLFASVLDALPMGVSLRDRERRFRYVNQWWRERLGFDPATQSGLSIEEIVAVGETVDMDALDRDVLEQEQTFTDVEARLYSVAGSDPSYGLVSKLPLRDADGVVEGIITCAVDITERRRAEQLLVESEQRYRLLYDDNPSMFFTIDQRGTLLQVNDFGARQLGYRPEDLVGINIGELHDDEDRELMRRNLAACFAEPDRMHRWEACRTRRNGEPLWVRETARTVSGSGGQPVVLTVCEDISEARSLSQELSWQASHDALTGLANRREFERRLALALESARGTGERHTLCYLDLDQFKVINDTCGHVAGDELLRQLGGLFHSRIRHVDTLARLGGDEFGMLMIDCGLEPAERICRGLRDSLEEFRFLWEGNSFRVGSSMGLVQIDNAAGAVSELLGAADAACYAAKERGPNRIHVYRRDDADLARRRGEMQWVSRIERALAEGRLSLAYQHIRPLAGAETGDHYELLLRMSDEEGRPVSPGDFLPAAERYGLATRLDRFVVKTAAQWLGAHRAHVDRLFLCCINLSGKTLSAEDFAAYVSATFAAAKVPLDRICFEITETAAIANLAHATRFIEELHSQGCRFALDDFGSGLSSFAYLKHLPVDFLKIDGMFVRDIAEDPIDLAMVRSISEIGHVMGKRTVAEFVESEVVLQRLRELGVDYGQGYHLGRPAPLQEMKLGDP